MLKDEVFLGELVVRLRNYQRLIVAVLVALSVFGIHTKSAADQAVTETLSETLTQEEAADCIQCGSRAAGATHQCPAWVAGCRIFPSSKQLQPRYVL